MACSFNPLGNPELDRILKISLPGRRLLFLGGFALAIALVVIGLEWNSYAGRSYYSSYEQAERAWRDSYWMLTVILFGLLFVLAPAMTALSIIQEKLRGTAIFQQMVLIKPLDIAYGKLVGSSAPSYFMAVVILPFALLAALLSGQKVEEVFSLYLFLFVGNFCFQAIGLFVSAAVSSPADKGLKGGLLAGPAVGLAGAVTALYWSRYFYKGYTATSLNNWYFYGIRVDASTVILALLVFIGFWAFAGAVRRIKASQLIPLKTWPVWLFFATAEAMLVGVLWGWQPVDTYDVSVYGPAPIMSLLGYMFINGAALLVLAGSLALSRNRLREWWSAGTDPLGLFQRAEIKNSFKTFVIALLISSAGIVALWTSYHMDSRNYPGNLSLHQLVPVVLTFALSVSGMLCFVQYCAMQRFRARAWAGVGLVVAFYLVAAVVGSLFEEKNNTASLLNPAVYAYELTRGDLYMDRASARYNSYDHREVVSYKPERTATSLDQTNLTTHALFAEGLLALGALGLAYLKWRKIEDEMLGERG
jgi:hypothetical protein